MKFRMLAFIPALLCQVAGLARADEKVSPNALYFVGDGDLADFAIEVKGGKEAVLYLTKKPTNEPLVDASVTLQSATGGGDIKFEAVKDSPGTYKAVLKTSTDLPGQIIIQTATDTDAIETLIPKYKSSGAVPSAPVPSTPTSGTSASQPKMIAVAFGAGVAVTGLLGFGAYLLMRRRRGSSMGILLAGIVSLPASLASRPAYAHGGHDHGGPSLDSEADTGGDVVMPKKSQLLIDLRTMQAKKEEVPGVIKTYGHIIPKPQLDATVTAPQAGFLHGTQGLLLGTKVQRGQLLGTLQAVGQIRLESPIDGEISEIDAVDGARVEAGGKLLRVTNLSVLWVDAEMFAAQLVELSNVTDVTIAVEGVTEPIKARLLNAVTPVSEETRTAKVFLELVNPPQALRMGMLATVAFALQRKTQAIPVPASAILNRAGDRIVFVQLGPETFTARQVTVEDGPVAGTVLITQGVNDGERVVISGNYQLLMKAK